MHTIWDLKYLLCVFKKKKNYYVQILYSFKNQIKHKEFGNPMLFKE